MYGPNESRPIKTSNRSRSGAFVCATVSAASWVCRMIFSISSRRPSRGKVGTQAFPAPRSESLGKCSFPRKAKYSNLSLLISLIWKVLLAAQFVRPTPTQNYERDSEPDFMQDETDNFAIRWLARRASASSCKHVRNCPTAELQLIRPGQLRAPQVPRFPPEPGARSCSSPSAAEADATTCRTPSNGIPESRALSRPRTEIPRAPTRLNKEKASFYPFSLGQRLSPELVNIWKPTEIIRNLNTNALGLDISH